MQSSCVEECFLHMRSRSAPMSGVPQKQTPMSLWRRPARTPSKIASHWGRPFQTHVSWKRFGAAPPAA